MHKWPVPRCHKLLSAGLLLSLHIRSWSPPSLLQQPYFSCPDWAQHCNRPFPSKVASYPTASPESTVWHPLLRSRMHSPSDFPCSHSSHCPLLPVTGHNQWASPTHLYTAPVPDRIWILSYHSRSEMWWKSRYSLSSQRPLPSHLLALLDAPRCHLHRKPLSVPVQQPVIPVIRM